MLLTTIVPPLLMLTELLMTNAKANEISAVGGAENKILREKTEIEEKSGVWTRS